MHRPSPTLGRPRTLEKVQAIIHPFPPPPKTAPEYRDARVERLDNVKRFRAATAGLNLVDIFRECLRAFALNEDLYGPLSTVVHQEYTRMVKDIAAAKDKLCVQWMTGGQQLGGGAAEHGGVHWEDTRDDTIATLEAEVRQLTEQLNERDRKIGTIENTATQLKVWLSERNLKIEELQLQLEATKELLDDRRAQEEQTQHTAPVAGKHPGGSPEPADDPAAPEKDALIKQLSQRVQSLEETAGEYTATVSEQTDRIALLTERLEFVQDMLREKVQDLQRCKRTVASLEDALARRPSHPPKQPTADASTGMEETPASPLAGSRRDKGRKAKKSKKK